MKPILKKDPLLIAASVIVVLGLFALVFTGKVTWAQASVVLGAVLFPSLFGKAPKDESTDVEVDK